MLRSIFAMLMVLTCLPSKAECGKQISIDANFLSYEGSLTLGSLKKRYGEWCQGHGPVSWYKEASGKEVWFWWKKPAVEAKSEQDADSYQVLFVALVKPTDENAPEIIWPRALKGKSAEKILVDAYRD